MSTKRQRSSLLERAALRRFYDGRRVLVVGGDGFLGRNCVDVLVSLDAHVSILTRGHSDDDRHPEIDRVFSGDLREPGLVEEAVSSVSTVFDFAGSSGAIDSNRQPKTNLEHECGGQLNLFSACAAAKHSPKVLFCSSRLVYGQPLYVPVDEKHPLSPQSFYAAHKIAAENYLKVFAQTHGLRYTVLRVSNPYGPHQGNRLKSYGVINQFLQRAARREPIRVYGSGHQIRDYVYAEDLVAMFAACGESTRCDGEELNVGGREAMRLRDAAETIARIADAPPVELVPWPADYQRIETGDYITGLSKLDRYFGQTEQLRLEEGFRLSVEAYREVAREAISTEAVSHGDSRVATSAHLVRSLGGEVNEYSGS